MTMAQTPRTPISAGLLLYRIRDGRLEVLLAHPGGPFWKNRDAGAWTIPKGLVEEGENLLDAACREFQEETGIVPHAPYHPLGEVRQTAGKKVHAWAWEGEADPQEIRSNLASVQLSTRSNQRVSVPEVDRCDWFGIDLACEKINPAQVAFLGRLQVVLEDTSQGRSAEGFNP